MAAPRRPWAERQREAKEEAQRSARQSLRIGVIGIVVLFLSGVGVVLWGFGILPWTDAEIAFLGGMVVGILLILVAFLTVRRSVLTFKPEDETKIY